MHLCTLYIRCKSRCKIKCWIASAIHLIFRACLYPDHVIYSEDGDGCLSGKLHQNRPWLLITAHDVDQHAGCESLSHRGRRSELLLTVFDTAHARRYDQPLTCMIFSLARTGSSTPASTLFRSAPLMRSRPYLASPAFSGFVCAV